VDLLNPKGETPCFAAAAAKCVDSCAALLDGGADPIARDRHPNIFRDGIWPDERKPDPEGKIKPKKKAGEEEFENPDEMPTGRTVVYILRIHGILDEVLSKVRPLTKMAFVKSVSEAIFDLHGSPALIFANEDGLPALVALLVSHSTALAHEVGRTLALGMTKGSYFQDERNIPGPRHGRDTPFNQRGNGLVAACFNRRWKCAAVVLAAGVPRATLNNSFDNLGRSALHIAASYGETAIVKLLLEANAATTLISMSGRQPLHEACAGGHLPVTKALLESGADARAKVGEAKRSWADKGTGDTGRSCEQMAAKRGHTQCADLVAKW